MRGRQFALIVAIMCIAALAPSAGAISASGAVEMEFALNFDGTGSFVATSDGDFFECTGTFADLFVGAPVFGEGTLYFTGERREMRCDDWDGVLTLQFDAFIKFPAPPECIQHSDVDWTVLAGTGDFTGWEGSGIFDEYFQVIDPEGNCGVEPWYELWTGDITVPSVSVIVGGCNTGVADHQFDDGKSFSGLISQAAAVAKNHGGFVKKVAGLADGWKKEGLITGAEQGAIVSCAARSDIP